MSEMIYFGNDASIAQQVEVIYIGDETNIARLVQQVFIGDEKNMAQLAFCAHEYGETQYDWYGYDSCTAFKTCGLCGHVVSEDGRVEIEYSSGAENEYDYKAYFDNFEAKWHCDDWHSDECNHNWEETVYYPPTCIMIGERYYKCSVCGEEMKEEVEGPPVVHSWGDDGKCTDCGDIKCNIDGHKWVEGDYYPPTCIMIGERYYKCSVCGEEMKEEVDTVDHVLGTDGKCKVCGQTIK